MYMQSVDCSHSQFRYDTVAYQMTFDIILIVRVYDSSTVKELWNEGTGSNYPSFVRDATS